MDYKEYIKYLLNEDKKLGELNDNFWKWFGKSKIINKNHKPITMYHGGDIKHLKSFTTTRDIGYHFAFDITLADRFSVEHEDDGEEWERVTYTKDIPLSVYIKSENPIWVDDLNTWGKYELKKKIEEHNEYINISFKNGKIKTPNYIDYRKYDGYDMLDNIKKFYFDITELESRPCDNYKNIDGFLYINDFERGDRNSQCIVVFSPNQIKSVYNSGEWSINNPNIYK
jgi:hypothetical protein